jgi:hypothetical protein
VWQRHPGHARQGEPMERIMLRGGWSAEATVIKYLREWQAI